MQLRYALYARKSSESKERQVVSIPDQITELELVKNRDGLNVVKLFKESKSAFKPRKRTYFDELVKLIRAGQIDGILTWKEDRIARNPEEGGQIIQLLQDRVLKEIRTPGAIYTPESDHLILQMNFGIANQFSRNLSQNVLRGLKHKAARGEYPNPAPLGYEGYGDTRQRKMRPHPTNAIVIRQFFEQAATGEHSLAKLQQFLFDRGITTNAGKKISKSHVQRMLQNPVYYGYFYYKGVLYEGVFEPIISKALFDKAQEGLKRRSKPRGHTWTDYQTYNGLIECSTCGCSVTTTVKRKHYKNTGRTVDYLYHHCTGRRAPCTQPKVTRKELEDELIRNVSKISIDLETMKLGLKLARAKYEQDITEYSKLRRNNEAKLKTIDERISRLVKLRMDEELTKEEFAQEKQLLLDEKAYLQQVTGDNSYQSAGHWLELAEEFFQKAFESGDVIRYGLDEEKRKLLVDVSQNLFLINGKIDMSYKMPYDLLAKDELRTNMQAY